MMVRLRIAGSCLIVLYSVNVHHTYVLQRYDQSGSILLYRLMFFVEADLMK